MIGQDEYYSRKKWYSPSSLCVTSMCLRKHFWKSGCRLCTVKPKHCSLDFGSAIHSALPVALTEGPARGIEEFKKVWADTEGDDKRCLSRAEDMICDFCLKAKPYEVLKAPESRLKGSGTGEFEIPFAIDIGLERPLAGKLDGWARHRVTGELWGVEYKTTSGLGTFFFEGFRRSPQIAAYSLAIRAMTGEDITGVMLEGLLVAKVKISNLLQPITMLDRELEIFLTWAKEQEERIKRCESSGLWPQNFAACNAYSWFWRPSGNCEFMDLCQAKDWRELVDGGLFEISTHEPLWLEGDNTNTKGA